MLHSIVGLLCFLLLPALARAQNYSDIWYNPSESGWGLTIADHQSQLFAVGFTYRQDGKATWFVIPGGTLSNNRQRFQADVFATTGPAFSAAPFDPSRVTAQKVGTATIDFASNGSATFTYSVSGVNQSKPIQRQPFGDAPPAWGSDFSDIWLNPAESGWGLTLAQHGSNVFGVWFTYDTDGQPLWVVMPGVTFSNANTFTGKLFTTTGPSFSSPTFDPSRVVATEQGTATVTVNRQAPLNLSCGGSENASLNTSFRGNSRATSICHQLFGDLPGDNGPLLSDPDFTRPFVPNPALSNSFMLGALTLLQPDVPEAAAYGPSFMQAELEARDSVLAQMGFGKVAAADVPHPKGLADVILDALGAFFKMASLPTVVGPKASSKEKDGAKVDEQLTGGTEPDGTVTMIYSLNGFKQGPPAVTVTGSAKMRGRVCPLGDGTVPFSIDVSYAADAVVGAKRAGGSDQLLVTGTVSVNDSANMVRIVYDNRYQNSRQRFDSNNAFIDGSVQGEVAGEWPSMHVVRETGKINRLGSTTTAADVQSISHDDLASMAAILTVFLTNLQDYWKSGKCVEVLASVPGTVAPGSTTRIDAKVRHKLENVDLAVPIDSSLAGAVSVQPRRVAAAPGTFSYVAPNESGRSATITLTTTSRRGIGTLDLAVETATSAYAVDWNEGGNHVFGKICGGLDQPFTLNFTSGGFITGTLRFTPSGASGGSVKLSGQGPGGLTYSGDGTYTLLGTSTIRMSIPTQTATIPVTNQVISVPGPSGDLPLTQTSQCST